MKKDKMKLEEAIRIMEEWSSSYYKEVGENDDSLVIDTVLQALQNSISKDIIRQKINERQFELQQEYKDFKDDIRLNTLQELYYYKED